LAAGIVIDQAGWRWAFVVGAIPAAVLVYFVSRLPEPPRGLSDGVIDAAGPESWGETLRGIARVRSLPFLIAASALSFGPAVGVTFWAPTFLRRHNDLTAGEAAGLFGFASLSGALLGAWVASKGPDRIAARLPEEQRTPERMRHIKLWIAAIGSGSGIVLLMLAYSPTPVSLKFPFLMLGAAGLVAAGPILTALISEVTPASRRGSVFSVNSFARLMLSALTPLAIGLVADQVVFVDSNVPLAIVEDQAVKDREDRYECTDEGTVTLGEDADDEDRAGINNYECGDEEVGHLGAGMVAVLAVGILSTAAALAARRTLDDDVAAVGAIDDSDPDYEPLIPGPSP